MGSFGVSLLLVRTFRWKQTLELPVIWDVMTVVWRHCNVLFRGLSGTAMCDTILPIWPKSLLHALTIGCQVATVFWKNNSTKCALQWHHMSMKGHAAQITKSCWRQPHIDGHLKPLYTWWRHQMDKFSMLLALCEGNQPMTSGFPSQRPVTRSFDVFFDLHKNKRLGNNRRQWFEAPLCSLWRHCNVSPAYYSKRSLSLRAYDTLSWKLIRSYANWSFLNTTEVYYAMTTHNVYEFK